MFLDTINALQSTNDYGRNALEVSTRKSAPKGHQVRPEAHRRCSIDVHQIDGAAVLAIQQPQEAAACVPACKIGSDALLVMIEPNQR
ncbi:hypothetical protein [Mesorhizobium sp. B2-7-1]|uniref:hypothetical protein n=1 Tax=Mesorhizobium sp. B2-7-1 TaxID=2589909 RepID=UPI0015E3AAAA|nr:hypothetical protein [Mesorhizobium sp. B2-7-1]